MTDVHVFPQDLATGLQETVDWNDAGSFAHLADHPNLRQYVASGFEYNVDWENDIINISGGKAYVYEATTGTNDHRENDGPDSKNLEHALFVVQMDASGDLNLNEQYTNYIFIDVNQSETDTASYFTNTTGATPSSPYILLGTADAAWEEVVWMNRNPTTASRRLVVAGQTHGEQYE